MTSKLTFLLLTLALLAAVAGPGAVRSTAASTLVVDDNMACAGAAYPTIQAAVAASSPGDTIKVCPGTYSGVVFVNHTLTFEGAQAGVDARTRVFNPAAESIVTDGFFVSANGVRIDGFTVQGIDGVADFGTGIYLSPAFSGYVVTNNIIQDNIFGLYLNSSGATQTVVTRNYFSANNRPGAAGGNAIYADQGSHNISVADNRFTGHTSAAMVFAGGSQSGISVTGNDLIGDNSMVFFNTNGITISRNLSDGSQGSVVFLGGGNSNVSITCNTFRNAPTRTAVRIANFGAGSNTGVTATNNNIENMAFGIRIDPGMHVGPLNAENNWWGSPTGPTTPSNPGGTGAAIVDPDGVVDYTPFRTAPVPDADNDGVLDSCDAQVGPPVNKDQCKNGGWQSFNAPRTFKNQGDCIQYVNTTK